MATLKSVKGDYSSVNFHLNDGIKEEISKTRKNLPTNLTESKTSNPDFYKRPYSKISIGCVGLINNNGLNMLTFALHPSLSPEGRGKK